MGEAYVAMIKLDVKKLIEELNKALADEWLAYYQYWVGAKVVEGKMAPAVQAELMEHANEELKHAEMLTDRIMQLGGVPILKPEDWYKMTNCGFSEPKDFSSEAILKQNIEGERCAIGIYHKLLEMTKDKDILTYHMLMEIYKDEVEHEDDLEKILNDLEK